MEVNQLRELVSEEKTCIEELKAAGDSERERAALLELEKNELEQKLKEVSAQANTFKEKFEA